MTFRKFASMITEIHLLFSPENNDEKIKNELMHMMNEDCPETLKVKMNKPSSVILAALELHKHYPRIAEELNKALHQAENNETEKELRKFDKSNALES